jgi:hypothetical protein
VAVGVAGNCNLIPVAVHCLIRGMCAGFRDRSQSALAKSL